MSKQSPCSTGESHGNGSDVGDTVEEQNENMRLLSRDLRELHGVVGNIDVHGIDRLMATESSVPVAECVTEQTALNQALELGLGGFGAFKNTEHDQSGDDTDMEDEPSTVAAEAQTGRKPSLSRYRAALEALSEEIKCLMTEEDLVQSELPSSLKTLLAEEQSRVRRLQRLKLKQISIESSCRR